jgi:hypothetical protein
VNSGFDKRSIAETQPRRKGSEHRHFDWASAVSGLDFAVWQDNLVWQILIGVDLYPSFGLNAALG